MNWELIITLLPPLLAIVITIISKKVLLGLGVGILSGAGILLANNTSISILFSEILSILGDSWNIKLIIALVLLGGFIGIMERALYRKEIFSTFFNSKRKVLIMGWITGIVLFIDDYFNILLNGLILKSFAKKYNISKEKIAFIIHSLGVSTCVLIPFSTWTIFIISIINNMGLEVNGVSMFVQSIPFNFYSISLMLTTLAVIIFEINILKMKDAEKEIFERNKIRTRKIKTKQALMPAIVIISISSLLILLSMKFSFSIQAIENVKFIEILIISSIVSIIFASFYYNKEKILRLKDGFRGFKTGAYQMKSVIGIMVFAWILGMITNKVGTTSAIVNSVQQFMTPELLIFISFIITGATAFMTSSWATFAIVIPLLIPLGMGLGINPSYILAAIVSGGVFGDHMSPISSTTILTKAVSKSNVHDHFHTQLPYGVIAFVISAYLFFLIGTI